MAREKVLKSVDWLTCSVGQEKVASLAVISELLMETDQLVQAADDRGGALWLMVDGEDGPLARCASELAQVLGVAGAGKECVSEDRGSTNVQMLIRHFRVTNQGESVCTQIRTTTMSIEAQLSLVEKHQLP